MTRQIVLVSVLILAFLAGEPVRADCGERFQSPACGSAPSALFDESGQLWVVFVDGGHVLLSRSSDKGLSFDKAVKVNHGPEEIYADGENRPLLAFGREGQVFVAWTRKKHEVYSGDIRFARSLDGGRQFEPAVTVNDDGLLTSHRFVSMAVTPSGLLYLAWLDKRDQLQALSAGADYQGAALYYTLSADAGGSFHANRKVADHSCECCRLALAPAGETAVKALWRHLFEEGKVRDHAIATLDKVGASDLERASRDGWRITGCPHHGPAMVAAEEGYHMAWFSNGEHQKGVIYGYHDGGSGKTTHVSIIDPRPSGGHPAVAASGDEVTVVWKSFDGERMNLRLAQSPDGGRHWHEAQTLSATGGGSDYPQLLKHQGALYVAWHTALEGYRLLPVPHVHQGD